MKHLIKDLLWVISSLDALRKNEAHVVLLGLKALRAALLHVCDAVELLEATDGSVREHHLHMTTSSFLLLLLYWLFTSEGSSKDVDDGGSDGSIARTVVGEEWG